MVGLKRSRALWDKARESHNINTTTETDHNNALLRSARHLLHIVTSYARAIGYELQPFRWSVVVKQQWPQWKRQLTQMVRTGCTETLPGMVEWWRKQQPHVALTNLTRRHYLYLALAVAYYAAVRWIHATLEAGPMVMIVTALVLIFTVGLGDEDRDDDTLSAYAVFNRGFQRLLGTVDQDDLMRQHLGGGGAVGALLGAGGGGGMGRNIENDDDNEWAARQPQRRQQQQPRQQRRQANDDNDQPEQQPPPPAQDEARPPPPRRARGKKARRGNLEQRRERRRQREAAAQMGFHGNGNADEDPALQHLLEEQIALAEAQQQQQMPLQQNDELDLLREEVEDDDNDEANED